MIRLNLIKNNLTGIRSTMTRSSLTNGFKISPAIASVYSNSLTNVHNLTHIMYQSPINLQLKRWNSQNKLNKEKILEKLAPLKENLYTIPNALTISRLLSTPFLGYWIMTNQLNYAMTLFVISGITDVLDGYIARKYKMESIVGSVLDPMADKALMTVMTLSLTYANLMPLPLAIVIIGRDLGLTISAFYYRWISLPPPKTFMRYFDFSLPSVQVKPTQISKINTFLQLGLVGSTLLSSWLGVTSHPFLTSFQYLVGATTIGSGLSYVFSKDAVKILKQAKNSTKIN